MTTIKINPNEINLESSVNERPETSLDEEFVESIRKRGILQMPTVRETDSGYEVVMGKRRIAAAVEIGLDEIEVQVQSFGDEDALVNSISENHFRTSTTPTERVRALTNLWKIHCEDSDGNPDRPSSRKISELTGISHGSIQNWLEATNTTWDDTVIEKEVEGESDTDFYDQLGESKVAALRRGVDKSPDAWDSEDIDELVQWAAEAELTITQCNEAQGLLAKGADTQTAMEAVTNDLVEETHRALDGGKADTTINAEPEVEDLDISLSDDEEDEEDGFETIELTDEERETQWLNEVEGAEEKFSDLPVPEEGSETDDVSEFEISFTIDDPHMVASMKAAMEQLGYEDPQQVVDLALERLLSMMQKEMKQ